MDVATFAEIEDEFRARTSRIVWCSVATVDRKGRPRTRVLHPIWEGAAGYIATGRKSFKAKHLAKTPYVSLMYWDPDLGHGLAGLNWCMWRRGRIGWTIRRTGVGSGTSTRTRLPRWDTIPQ